MNDKLKGAAFDWMTLYYGGQDPELPTAAELSELRKYFIEATPRINSKFGKAMIFGTGGESDKSGSYYELWEKHKEK